VSVGSEVQQEIVEDEVVLEDEEDEDKCDFEV